MVRVDFGFVALDVDDDVGVQTGDGLGDAVGPALVGRVGHHALGAECPGGLDDSLVVGSDEHSLRQGGLAGPLVGVLDEIFAGILGENFPGEPGRIVPRRYTDYDFHRRSNMHV